MDVLQLIRDLHATLLVELRHLLQPLQRPQLLQQHRQHQLLPQQVQRRRQPRHLQVSIFLFNTSEFIGIPNMENWKGI